MISLTNECSSLSLPISSGIFSILLLLMASERSFCSWHSSVGKSERKLRLNNRNITSNFLSNMDLPKVNMLEVLQSANAFRDRPDRVVVAV